MMLFPILPQPDPVPVQLENGLGNWLFEDGSVMCWGDDEITIVTLIRPLTGRVDTYNVIAGLYYLADSDSGNAG